LAIARLPRQKKRAEMAKFYISFCKGDDLVMDDEGIEAPNIEVAGVAAIRSARELVADSLKYDGGPIPFTFPGLARRVGLMSRAVVAAYCFKGPPGIVASGALP
jgi:hypothetical protein